jgi:transposase-like protein
MDEARVRIRGQRQYLHLAVDKATKTVDFLPTAKRDRHAAWRCLCKAIGEDGAPAKITIAQGGANTAAIESCNLQRDTGIYLRRVNNVVEQDPRAARRHGRAMTGFNAFRPAGVTLAEIDLMLMICKARLKAARRWRPARRFYSLASRFSRWPGLHRCRAEFTSAPGILRAFSRRWAF